MDSAEITEAGSAFQTGMVRGKKEYFRVSEYVRDLVYCNFLSLCLYILISVEDIRRGVANINTN